MDRIIRAHLYKSVYICWIVGAGPGSEFKRRREPRCLHFIVYFHRSGQTQDFSGLLISIKAASHGSVSLFSWREWSGFLLLLYFFLNDLCLCSRFSVGFCEITRIMFCIRQGGKVFWPHDAEDMPGRVIDSWFSRRVWCVWCGASFWVLWKRYKGQENINKGLCRNIISFFLRTMCSIYRCFKAGVRVRSTIWALQKFWSPCTFPLRAIMLRLTETQ